MNRILFHSTKNNRQNCWVFVALLWVLLSSCPLKSSIKSLMGLPVKTEQGLVKGNSHFVGNEVDKCAVGERVDTDILAAPSFLVNQLLPAIFITAAFLFLFSDRPDQEQTHPFYGHFKISGTIPIFLAYRKLII